MTTKDFSSHQPIHPKNEALLIPPHSDSSIKDYTRLPAKPSKQKIREAIAQ